MEFLLDPNIWIAFAMLTALEIVLGIDNIIFISILVGRLPPEHRDKARKLGLGLAMGTRLLLLLSLSWVMGLTTDLFNIAGQGISGRDIVLLLGGLFLLYKASHEIFVEVEARIRRVISALKAANSSTRSSSELRVPKSALVTLSELAERNTGFEIDLEGRVWLERVAKLS